MPWKNGGGSTTELLVEPPGATLQSGFHWRLSMASLEQSGPFSSFPGFDRTLLLVEGRGLELDFAGKGGALLKRPLEAATFPGEWEVQGRLLDGPCLDFNVMSERARFRHEVYVLRPGMVLTPLPAGPLVLIYCVTGQVAIPALEQTLGSRDLLRLEGEASAGVCAREPDSALVVAVFHPQN